MTPPLAIDVGRQERNGQLAGLLCSASRWRRSRRVRPGERDQRDHVRPLRRRRELVLLAAVVCLLPFASASSARVDAHAAGVPAGSILGWGANTYGQLGDGTRTNSPHPVHVQGISNAVQVMSSSGNGGTALDSHSCALLADHTVHCWGQGLNGEPGNGVPRSQSSVPVQVQGITTAVQVAVGGEDSCALLADGTVRCWGSNYEEGLGTDGPSGYLPFSATPVQVNGISGATQIAVPGASGCALVAGGQIRCWGNEEATGVHGDTARR